MQAIVIEQPGGPDMLKLHQVPLPVPRPGEVLIAVAAAGVNGPDLAQRRGHYDPPPGASPLPGLEVAGTIAALTNVGVEPAVVPTGGVSGVEA